ncbi:alpha-ketoglutarate-dependent dioxygenase AlkB [Hasllibacter sp. MH4015]|uniref:alpha-ketoglutarate-dependent dioxygenase AlkB family protein n=1 Tax=Hasllibacter sp. MH4015 TaxID=2854029 RepID=UPI001CD4F681|nr:alpha-ketoglutarate-dependent dioxygenase AlkB [Hasllibacter sp. MH4015]
MQVNVGGIFVHQGYIDPSDQAELLDQVRRVVRAAPLYRPETKTGRKMSVRMTSAGTYGWMSDRKGYRYERRHPEGMEWPPIPKLAKRIWRDVAGVPREPQSCLINFYDADAKMGLHQDRDEADFEMPVLSISLGDDARFRVGGPERGGKTEAIWLRSGDVALMGGDARLNFHGIDKIRAGSSSLLPNGGRINLTLRVVD